VNPTTLGTDASVTLDRRRGDRRYVDSLDRMAATPVEMERIGREERRKYERRMADWARPYWPPPEPVFDEADARFDRATGESRR
jgi:hypothetical protein